MVSGPAEDVEAILLRFEAAGVRVRRLNTAKAFHSALVEPILDALEGSLDVAAISPPALTMVSNLTGRAVETGELLDGELLADGMRATRLRSPAASEPWRSWVWTW